MAVGVRGQSWYHRQVRAFQRRIITSALVMHRGNVTRAARELGIQRPYLYRLISKLEVDRDAGRQPHLTVRSA